MGDVLEKLGKAIESFAWDHPRAVGGVVAFFIFGTITSSVLRTVFRDQTTRPAWARGVLAGLDPFIGNLWGLLSWAAAKVGLKVQQPFGDLTDSIRQAQKDQP